MSTIIVPDVDYPTGDGKPMAETPVHRLNMTDAIAVLESWFKDRPDVYVSGNMMLYYVEGDPLRHVSPDTFVVIGVEPRDRRAYKTWEERKPTLDFVIEFTSKSTRREDQVGKLKLYQDVLKVREYVLFDPFEEYLKPAPQLMYRLQGGVYVRVDPVDGRLPSQVLNLHLERQDDMLRFWNPATRKRLLTQVELTAEANAQADAERRRADAERRRADAERRRKEAAEQEVARLKALLEGAKKSPQ